MFYSTERIVPSPHNYQNLHFLVFIDSHHSMCSTIITNHNNHNHKPLLRRACATMSPPSTVATTNRQLELRKRALFRRSKSFEDLNVVGGDCDLHQQQPQPRRGGKRNQVLPRRHKSHEPQSPQEEAPQAGDRWASQPRRGEDVKSDQAPRCTCGQRRRRRSFNTPTMEEESSSSCALHPIRKDVSRWDSDSSFGSDSIPMPSPPRRSNSQEMPAAG